MTEKTTEAVKEQVGTRGADGVMYGGWTGPFVILVATLISYIDRQALSSLAPTILKETGLTATDFGVILSFFSIAYMLANPFWGSILDHIGLRTGMAIAVLIWTVASASHALISTFAGFALARTVLGIGEGAVFPGCMKTATDCLPLKLRARGAALGYSGAAAGAFITPIIVIPFALKFGWRTAFWITGALGVAWMAWWYLVCRPPKVPVKPRTVNKISLPNPLDRRFWLIVFTYGTGAVALGVVLYMSPLYLNRAIGVSQKDLAWIGWIPFVPWWLGYYAWAWVSDRMVAENPRPVWVLLTLSVLALPVAFTGYFHSWPVVVAFFSWAMFIADGFIVMGLHVGARVYARDQSGMAAGIGGGAWSMVLALVLPVYGKWIEQQSFERIFVTMSLIPLAGTLVYLWLSLPWKNARHTTAS